MPIGNQEIWDKGIGAGATNVIFGQQPQQTNFNPGALGADPNAQPAAATAQPAQPSGPVNETDFSSLQQNTTYHLVNGQYMTDEEYQKHLAAGGAPATMSGQRTEQNSGYKSMFDKQGEAQEFNMKYGVGSNPNNPKLQTGSGKLMSG